MTAYRFTRTTARGLPHDTQHRDLPDDNAAIAWMGRERVGEDEELQAYRAGETEPFARREFAEDAQVLA